MLSLLSAAVTPQYRLKWICIRRQAKVGRSEVVKIKVLSNTMSVNYRRYNQVSVVITGWCTWIGVSGHLVVCEVGNSKNSLYVVCSDLLNAHHTLTYLVRFKWTRVCCPCLAGVKVKAVNQTQVWFVCVIEPDGPNTGFLFIEMWF